VRGIFDHREVVALGQFGNARMSQLCPENATATSTFGKVPSCSA
jgi:hypothetical protein